MTDQELGALEAKLRKNRSLDSLHAADAIAALRQRAEKAEARAEQYGLASVEDINARLVAESKLIDAEAERDRARNAALDSLDKELNTIKWLGSDEGWDLAIKAVQEHIRTLIK